MCGRGAATRSPTDIMARTRALRYENIQRYRQPRMNLRPLQHGTILFQINDEHQHTLNHAIHTYPDPNVEPKIYEGRPTFEIPEGFQILNNTLLKETETPIIVEQGPQRILCAAQWGFVPSSQKKRARTIINIRSDNEHLNFFAKERRCVFICDGFYEWKNKIPFFITPQSKKDVMYLAAIFSPWYDEEYQVQRYTFAVVTTDAGSLEFIHDRKPIILPNEESVEKWLNGEKVSNFEGDIDHKLRIFPVSDFVVNSTRKTKKVTKKNMKPVGPIRILDVKTGEIKFKEKKNSIMSSFLKSADVTSDSIRSKRDRDNKNDGLAQFSPTRSKVKKT